CIQGTQLWTF
nr:immunoglobulin light chain junction region [Macaca mulatta]